MFANTSIGELSKAANPSVFTSNDKFFDNWYGEKKGEEIKKSGSFVFAGSPAAAGDTGDVYANTARGNYRNYIYGKQLWAQMNIRPTVFTAIPRNQYVKSGFRIVKNFATRAGRPNAVSEAMSQIPDVKVPTITSLRIDPRVVINNPYSMTLAQQALDGLDDTVNFDAILEILQTEFSMRVNGQMLMHNINWAYDPATDTDAGQQLCNYAYWKELARTAGFSDTDGMPICTLDNLISGYTEYTGLSYPASNMGYEAVDLFNLDRHSAASELDSYVSYATSTAAVRNVSVDLLDDAVQHVMPYWKDNTVDGKVIITNFDTVGRIQQLHYQFQRFIGYGNYQTTYNGIKTCPGDVVGFGASQFKGIPIIPDLMVTRNLAGTGVGKIYVVDTNTIHHAILIPPTFIQDKTYIARRSLTDVATYYMASEMVCTKPRANAKIMNLQ
jgi:hypothetical protein